VNKEQKRDEEMHEFQRLMKLLTQCNVTAIEILWSDEVRYEHPVMEQVRRYKSAFIDAKKLHDAACGYSRSQLHHVDQTITLGTLNTDSKRAGKFAAAYVRVMSQAIALLRDGDYSPRDVGPYRDAIVRWKTEGMTMRRYREFNLIRRDLEKAIARVYEANADRFSQDVQLIEWLTRDVYVEIDREYEARGLDRAPRGRKYETTRYQCATTTSESTP
jgi:hypothetical protein